MTDIMWPPATCVTPSNCWTKMRARKCSTFCGQLRRVQHPRAQDYLGVAQYAPNLWGGFRSCWKSRSSSGNSAVSRACTIALEKILAETQPDCVVSTYPAYGHVIKAIYRAPRTPFQIHHRHHGILGSQSRLVPRSLRYFLRRERSHRRRVGQGRCRAETNPNLGFPVNPEFADSRGVTHPAGR